MARGANEEIDMGSCLRFKASRVDAVRKLMRFERSCERVGGSPTTATQAMIPDVGGEPHSPPNGDASNKTCKM